MATTKKKVGGNGKSKAKVSGAKSVRTPRKTTKAISQDERHHMISVVAYHIAERRQFAEGDSSQDWLQAERQVDQLLGGM